MMPIRRVSRKENTCVISLLVFCENRKSAIFKLLSSVVYCIMENYICAYYLCSPQTKAHVSNELFENTTYNDISLIVIIELLMNIISCNGLVKNMKPAVILSYRSRLVDYYLKMFCSS